MKHELGWLVGTALDPIKIGWALFLIFKPRSWPVALGIAVVIGIVTSFLSSLGLASLSFAEWLPYNVISAVILAAGGNLIGRMRSKNEGN
jgi:hypothetical protein